MEDKLKQLNLLDTYNWVMENNKSKDLPYHSNYHLKMVTETALKGCEAYLTAFDDFSKRLVGAAALFHDFNHTGSGKNDDENIEIAIESFKDYNKNFNKFSNNEEELIIDLIESTRFPYVKTSYDLTLPQNVLRDADILQGHFSDDYLNKIVFALQKEGYTESNKVKTLQNQLKFIESLKFGTSWGNLTHKEHYQRLVDIITKEIQYETTMTRDFIAPQNLNYTLGEHLANAEKSAKEISIKLYKFDVFDQVYHVVLEDEQEPYLREFINRILETDSDDEIKDIKYDVATKYMCDTHAGLNEEKVSKIIASQPGRQSIRIFNHLDKAENDLKEIIKSKRRDNKINKIID